MTEQKPNSENKPARDARGRLLPGHCGVPGSGRPKGSTKLDVAEVCRIQARKRGVDLEEMVFLVVTSLAEQARAGNMRAAEIFLDRLAGPVEQALKGETGPQVAVQVNTGGEAPAGSGPPVPPSRTFADYMDSVRDVAYELRASTETQQAAQAAIDKLLE